METNRIFRGFCINRFGIGPYATFQAIPILASNSWRYSYSKNDFPTQRYRESATLCINDTRSRQLSDSKIRGVDNSPRHWYPESTTPRITDTESWYWIFLKKTHCISDTESRQLRISLIRRCTDSPYRWFGKSPTPLIVDTESRRLPVSLSRGVDDSAYRWYGESLVEKKN